MVSPETFSEIFALCLLRWWKLLGLTWRVCRSGVSCLPLPCSLSQAKGFPALLSAEPTAGWDLCSWHLGLRSPQQSCCVTAQAHTALRGSRFEIKSGVFFYLFLAIITSRMVVYALSHGSVYAGLVDLIWKICGGAGKMTACWV